MTTGKWMKIREFLFPIKGSEIRNFLPLFFLYFCLAFIYNGLRPLKITLVTSVSNAGAEIIPFLKVWGIMPAAFFFTFLFTHFSRLLNRAQLFYLMMSIFLGYYFVFGLWLYPYSEQLSLDQLSEFLRVLLPPGFRGFISMLQYWHVSLFYILCEVWSSAVMFVLFWGYVNEITPIEAASRFYPLYNLGGNLASTASGYMVMQLARNQNSAFQGLGGKGHFSFNIIMLSVALGLAAIMCFYYANKNKLNAASKQENSLNKGRKGSRDQQEENERVNLTLLGSFTEVARSKYLLCLLVLVLAYNLVFNLTDVLWSQQVKDYFGSDQANMTSFMGKVTMYKGFLSVFLVFGAHTLINKFGWMFTTLVTPCVILGSSLIFFPLVFLEDNATLQLLTHELFSSSILWLAVVVGGIQNALTRGAKYSLYDTTREMAFIPLSTDMKRKGKAVIDGIASRIGKSGGSVIYMILLPLCSSLAATTPYIAAIAMGVTVIWVYAVWQLQQLMTHSKEKETPSKHLHLSGKPSSAAQEDRVLSH